MSGVGEGDRPPVSALTWPSASPVAFIPSGGFESRARDAEGSYENLAEAQAAAAVVRCVLRAGELSASRIGVVTPYSAQVARIERELRSGCGEGAAAVEVSTVDGFQGREKELILLSTVRSNEQRALGFVADARRMNVAITRARRGLVVLGDAETLASDGTWRAYLQWLERRGCVTSLRELCALD